MLVALLSGLGRCDRINHLNFPPAILGFHLLGDKITESFGRLRFDYPALLVILSVVKLLFIKLSTRSFGILLMGGMCYPGLQESNKYLLK